jgi:hypothetical protein
MRAGNLRARYGGLDRGALDKLAIPVGRPAGAARRPRMVVVLAAPRTAGARTARGTFEYEPACLTRCPRTRTSSCAMSTRPSRRTSTASSSIGRIDAVSGAPSGRLCACLSSGDDPLGRVLGLRIWSEQRLGWSLRPLRPRLPAGAAGRSRRRLPARRGPRRALSGHRALRHRAACLPPARPGWRFLIGLAIACTAYALSNLSNPLKQPIAADIVPAGGLGAEPA